MGKLLKGRVVEGNRIGRKIGFPTANILCSDAGGMRPGVYAVRAEIDGRQYGGMANYGPKPTVGEARADLLEVHFFGFCGNLYGREIAVEPVAFLREIRKFASLEELGNQIEKDRRECLKILGNREES